MRIKATISLSSAMICLSLLMPQFAWGESKNEPAASSNSASAAAADTTAARSEATAMVPAQAALVRPIDAKKTKAGTQIRVKLAVTVQLKNGPKLPAGTALIGTVDDAEAQASGGSKLVLNFTQAELKDGKVVPVKATIVGVYAPANEDADGHPLAFGTQVNNGWNDSMLKIDVPGALSGIDLHSAIADKESGTLVATKKNDVKLAAGSEIALALAAQTDSK